MSVWVTVPGMKQVTLQFSVWQHLKLSVQINLRFACYWGVKPLRNEHGKLTKRLAVELTQSSSTLAQQASMHVEMFSTCSRQVCGPLRPIRWVTLP